MQIMDQDTTERMAAAHLAAALLNSKNPVIGSAITGQRPPPAEFAAELYFDCLEAIQAERAKRHRARTES
jgi:hypothetical protein